MSSWSLAFGDDADGYDNARPSYPSELIDFLVADGPPVVADIGCGTGIAARLLAARGCRVVGVEPDPRMAKVAARHGIDTVVTTFEDWEPAEQFDLVTAAQSWHWVRRELGPAKVAAVLRPGGRFAAFWNSYHLPADMLEQFLRVYEDLAPQLLEFSISLGLIQADNPYGDNRYAADLDRSGFFADVRRRSYWTPRCTTRTRGSTNLRPTAIIMRSSSSVKRKVFDAVADIIRSAGDSMTINLRTGLVTALRV